MGISRRQLLSLLPTAGLATTITPGRAQVQPTVIGQVAASGGQGDAVDADAARLLANTVAILAGDPEADERPEVAAKLAGIDKTARTWLAAMKDTDPPGGELFTGIPLGTSDPNLTVSFQHLYEIALATSVPGGPASDLHGNTAVRRRVLDGLAWLHDHYYGDQAQGYYGNWFNWEIGISTHVSRTLVLLADEVHDYRPDLARTYVASMDAYLRNGKDGDVDLDSRFHTGANLADITTNRILQGAVVGDEARVGKALADQLTVFATVDPYHLEHGVTDGYYADGSFIQHDSVAYTGSYGKGLLTRVVQTLKILDGTSYVRGDDLVSVVDGWVRDGFAPLIFEGWMMEVVKGRAVSRTTTGYADVAVVVEAVVDLSSVAEGAAAAALKSYVKFIRETSRATLDPTRFVSPVSIARYADIVADDTIPARDLNPASRSVAFNAMDRHVHLRPGYAFALARSSERISKYEYMSGENLLPWFQGDGAYYLYLSGQDQAQAYGIDYFTTVSPYALAGVTSPVERRRTIPELYGTPYYDNPDHPLNFTSSSESQNTYVYFPRGTNRHSGGAILGAFGAAAMIQSDDVAYAAKQKGLLPDDFVVYQNATAHKSWFMLDEEVVVLAAGVGDPSGRAVLTTVDSRTAAPTDTITISGVRRDGSAWAGTGTADLSWLRYANADQGTSVGYVFLDTTGPVRVATEQVTRSRRVVRTANPDTAITRSVFGVHLDHAPGVAPSSLAYALVPNATERQLGSYGEGRVVVAANTTQVQAVRHTGLGLTAVNTFGPDLHNVAGVRVDGPASVLVQRRRDGRTEAAVADPTTDRETISVVLRGRPLTPVAPAEGVRVSAVAGGTRLDVDTHQLYGRSRTVTLGL
ncbi:polysaccharide lyase family 8 super-sandwich domain-containing protein [Actinopolymorpha rutila]|uniref:Hyaluronate lyase n=1 Tax=Actinopolymorpha rutila TaxID=446787 RepID=A0A852ZM39_9ACTN|nr:polysaccharide lyase family 8 super-sandwich domain-containing protein [Actinopolymorpha rutila]NYH93195.1 hyaluronate lyase [Actinopolymorpha rutila]